MIGKLPLVACLDRAERIVLSQLDTVRNPEASGKPAEAGAGAACCRTPLRQAEVRDAFDWREEPIGGHHHRADFDCGSPALIEYFVRYARQNHASGGAKTFVAAA